MKEPFNRYIKDIPPSKIRAFFELVSGRSDIISLGVGEPDVPAFWTIREEAISALEKGHTHYSSNAGLPELRETVSRHYHKLSGTSYDPDDHILITNGASEAIDIALRALLNPNDGVILPQPIYVCYEPLLKLLGADISYLNTIPHFVPKAKDIKACINKNTKLLILCYPNNPTGKSIPKKELKAIFELCEKENIYILSDEIYLETLFSDSIESIAQFDRHKKRVLVVNGLSKAYAMTGLRIGYMCGPKDWLSYAAKIHQYAALCANTISQYAGLEALNGAKQEQKHFVASLKRRAIYMTNRFKKMGLSLEEPDGGLYCFVNIKKTGLNANDFALKLLDTQKVACVPGLAFSPHATDYIRCCFANHMNTLKEALDRIETFIKTL